MRSITEGLTFRILTKPYYGREHDCAPYGTIRCADEKCPMCTIWFPTIFYVVGAIDIADGNYYEFKFDLNFYSKISKLSTNWGDPKDYDIKVNVKELYDKVSYTATYLMKRALTPREQEIKEKLDLKALELNTKPFPVDCVKGFMRRNHIKSLPDFRNYRFRQII